jgi:hypothetical protein
MIVDDFPGDAEHAWERLGQSSVGLVELLQVRVVVCGP